MNRLNQLCLFLFFFLCFQILAAQVLESESRVDLLLSDSTQVELYKAYNATGYYALPTNLRVSEVNGNPEFSFLAYDEDGDSINDGAIMHLLLKWGLDKAQEKEAQMLLEETHNANAVIWGTPQVEPLKGQSWRIYHAKDSIITNLLQDAIYTKARIPTHAGGKWAASFRFDASATASIEEILQDEVQLKQIFVEWHYIFKQTKRKGYATRSTTKSLVLRKSMYELIGILMN